MNPANAPSVHPTRRTVVLTLLCVGLVLFYRKPDALLHPQFWAEDGKIFFGENYLHGWHAIFLPYSGYYHAALRSVAWLASFFPVLWQPAIYAWVVLGMTLGVAAKLFSPRVHLPYKPLLALAIVLVPRGAGEILLTLTAVQWFLALLMVLFLIQDEAGTPLAALGDLLILGFVGLSGPFSILFLPLFVLRLVFVSRSAWSVLCTGIVAVCAAIQLSAVLRFPAGPNEHPSLHQWLEAFVLRPVGSLMLGSHLGGKYLGLPLALVVGAGLLALLATLAVRQRTIWWTLLVLLGAAAAVDASAGYRFVKAADALFADFDSGDRYFYLPKLLYVWCLLICLPGERWRSVRDAAIGVLGVTVLAAATDFLCPSYGNTHWTEQVRQLERGETKIIHIAPPGWIIDLNESPLSTPSPALPDRTGEDLAAQQDILETKPDAIMCPVPLLRVTIEDRPFLQVHPVGAMTFDLPPGSREVSAEFAIRPEASTPPQHTVGATFRIDYLPKDGGAATTLWEHVLRPSEIPADRGVKTLRVALPPEAAGQLVLRTLPPPGTEDVSAAWACWARVRITASPTTSR